MRLGCLTRLMELEEYHSITRRERLGASSFACRRMVGWMIRQNCVIEKRGGKPERMVICGAKSYMKV